MELHELKSNKIGFCLSGGLSSLTVSTWLFDQGVDVVNFIADIGQTDKPSVDNVVDVLNPKGIKTIAVDLRSKMADMCFDLLKYQAIYGDEYWNITSSSRAVLVMGLSQIMRQHGCTMLAHGSVGGGNDQKRFDRYVRNLASDLKLLVPWCNPELLKLFPNRTSMIEYLTNFGLDIPLNDKDVYSTDANLAGISHEGVMLESLETPCSIVEPLISVWPQQAPNEPTVFEARFEAGHVVEINGKVMKPLDIMLEANRIAGRNGIWHSNVVENRINGTKGRGIYEAP